jgi:phosphopantetheine--protein transferase-like protein
VAIAGDGSGCLGVGIDMEYIGRIQEGFERVAFTGEEQNLLSEIAAPREEWSLRLWCAKEAVAKALGRGMLGGPGSLVAQHIDAHTGMVQIALSGEMAEHFPELRGTHLTAYTAREGALIVASSCYTRS